MRPSLFFLLFVCAHSLVDPLYAQTDVLVDPQGLTQTPRELIEESPRELSVLSPTLAPEEIDRAVLDRLLNQINQQPDIVAEELLVTDPQLTSIAITLSNAKNFINDNEIASIRAMCNAWNQSTATGDERIKVALDAYKTRRQFTLDFIARYYRVVLSDIRAMLNPQSGVMFDRYMEDRRRRMTTAGASYSGAVTENVRSGAESVMFHCGEPRR